MALKGMTAAKYTAIGKVANPTATRDLQHLLTRAIFVQEGPERSVRYQLNLG